MKPTQSQKYLQAEKVEQEPTIAGVHATPKIQVTPPTPRPTDQLPPAPAKIDFKGEFYSVVSGMPAGSVLKF